MELLKNFLLTFPFLSIFLDYPYDPTHPNAAKCLQGASKITSLLKEN